MDNWACVEKVEQNKHVSYWLYNKKPFVVSVTLDVQTSNLKSSNSNQGQYIVNQVLQGHQRIKVLELQPMHQGQKIWYDESFYWTPGNMLAVHHGNIAYQYPYAKGAYFPIVQGFGGGYSHRGASKYAVDFAMPIGTPIHAARAGVVIDLVAQNSRGGANRRYAKYANYVVILHDDDTTGEYYHLEKNGVAVTLGERVKVGQKIAYSGNTGFSSLPHLHFAIYQAKPFGKYQSLPFVFD
ncbi:M23 family metallopeptidase [uncultured Paraglaciecola sp.]|uniref:M23 family metallopeptidase n=1 Tax=uncultured Paraglaciecola sp. TaxID=1765024 RepID=UPI0030D97297|tara:strand:+ start:74008 stop:74724 length:717 start_codon:yes stop_codon:yes gene_type:complete